MNGGLYSMIELTKMGIACDAMHHYAIYLICTAER